MQRAALLAVLGVLWMGASLTGCETIHLALSKQSRRPAIGLERIELCYPPATDRGPDDLEPRPQVRPESPVCLAFVLNIHNPNPYKLMLDELRFTLAFEDFDLIAPMLHEDQWIPAYTTNQLRLQACLDPTTALLALRLTSNNAEKWQRMGVQPEQLVTKWWREIGDLPFAIQLKDGVASFERPDGRGLVAGFQSSFLK